MALRAFKAVVVAFAMMFIGHSSAKATPTVLFSADQGATWSTLSGSSITVGSWRVNAAAFSTAGLEGQIPELGFTSFSATSRLPGNLMVRLYDTGFQWGDQSGYFLSQINGSIAGGSRLAVKTYVDADNDPFNTSVISADLLTSQGYFYMGTLNSEAVNRTYGIPTGQFSMMFQATITQRIGGGRVTFSSSFVDPSVPDGGATLMLLGLGLASLATIRRDRKGSV